MSFPQNVKVVAVSTTINPVTHTAEVAVNKASRKESWFPSVVVKGSRSRIAPVSIKNRKDKRMVCAGFNEIPSKNDESLLNLRKTPVRIKKFLKTRTAGGIIRRLACSGLTVKIWFARSVNRKRAVNANDRAFRFNAGSL